jgi:hypothetical protein
MDVQPKQADVPDAQPPRFTIFKNGDDDMMSTKPTTASDGDNHMNINQQATTINEHTIKPTAAQLIRWAGLAAMGAGIIYVVIQPIHPPDVLASVTTSKWVIIQSLKTTMSLLGLLGMAGLYARQVKETGWLGLAGYLLLSFFYALGAAFQFAEAFILPLLATEAPTFVEGFLGIVSGAPSEVNLGALPTLFALTGGGYILGGLLFGIATFRAGILPRWAAGLLAVAAAVTPAGALVGHPLNRIFAVPVGLALAWLGYALWSERREHAADPVPGRGIPQLRPAAAE